MRNDPVQHSNRMPFFWAKLVAPALLFGLVTTGCAAGGGGLEGESNDEPTFAGAPLAPTITAPTIANPGQGTTPASSTASAAAGNGANAASTLPPTNVASSNTDANAAGDEDSSGSEGDPNAASPIDDGDDDDDDDDDDPGNPGGANDDVDDDGDADDDDDDGDADDDDDDGDADDDDDDDGDADDDDDDGDADDDDDDGDDDADVTPTPNPPAPNPPAPAPDGITFTTDVRPILVTNCGRCHASGGLPTFASANADSGFDVAFRLRNDIVSEIRSGSMPEDTCNGSPGSNGCVSVADFNLIQQWVAAGAPE
jgi:hypothetical protein